MRRRVQHWSLHRQNKTVQDDKKVFLVSQAITIVSQELLCKMSLPVIREFDDVDKESVDRMDFDAPEIVLKYFLVK